MKVDINNLLKRCGILAPKGSEVSHSQYAENLCKCIENMHPLYGSGIVKLLLFLAETTEEQENRIEEYKAQIKKLNQKLREKDESFY